MKSRSCAAFALALCALPATVFASSLGPADGFAGNPPDNFDCTLCHFSFPVNSGDGGLQILGLPAEYVPGQTYALTVQLEDPGQARWGFELTVLDDADFLQEGGSLLVTDAVNTQISENSGGSEVDFLKQTSEGTYQGQADGPVTWDFEWVAPDAAVESVTFYVAGNAADGDLSFSNDYIYTGTYGVRPGDPTPTLDSTWGAIKQLFVR